MSTIVVVGSMAFDTLETPFGKVDKILGGSANFFSIAASYFTKVQAISIVGEDFPTEHLALLNSRHIETTGVQIEKGKTFHWSGRYGYDLNVAQTLNTELNVYEKFEPEVPESYRNAPFLFLGNIAPHFQLKVASEMRHSKFIALDTMNFWIEGHRDALIEAIGRSHAVLLNEAEARELTRCHNLVEAAKHIQGWGPKVVVIKRGEYGAMLFEEEEIFCLPGLPLTSVKDPTGAGDSFAGGFMGYLASQGEGSDSRFTLRKAVVYGSVMASFAVQDFGFRDLLKVTSEVLEARYRRFTELTIFH